MPQTSNIVVVTGTSTGIGASLATTLAESGWTVIGMARRPSTIRHPAYRHHHVDLADLDTLPTFFENTLREPLGLGHWDRVALVNNAASTGLLRGMEQAEPRDLAAVFAVNTIAPMYLMASVARVARPGAALRIVNLSSGAGVHGFPGLGDYGGSKAALRLAGMVLAAELASDERPAGRHADFGILSFSPGPVDTEMQASARAPTTAMPWNQIFLQFAASGMLMAPSDVTGPIVDFLTAEIVSPFSEQRFTGDRE